MLRNRLWTLTSAVIVAATTLVASSQAKADATLAIGMKWEPVNYTNPVSTHGNIGGTGAEGTRLYGWQTTSLNNYIGAFFGKNGQFGFHLGLDLGYGKVSVGVNGSDPVKDTMSFLQFGFALGGKFYILPPKRDRVAPYFYLDFFKYFASVNTNDENIDNATVSFIAGLNSPVGATFAVGAEYFFSPAFSLGGEIFGFRLANATGRIDDAYTSRTYFTMYTAFTLNYRFLITGSVSVREVEGQEQGNQTPRRQPPPQRRPPQDQPPPSAESVD